jgi:hypothetical protein
VADVGKTRQNRRLKLLKQKPIADDVLDVVRHHGKHGGHEEKAKVSVAERYERYSLLRNG